MKKRCLLHVILLLFVLSVGFGCVSEVAGGGDDFPNAMSELGAILCKNTATTVSIPDIVDIDSVLGYAEFDIVPENYSVSQKKVKRDTSYVDSLRLSFSDLRQGIIHVYYFYHSDSIDIMDTSSYRFWPDTLIVAKRGMMEFVNTSLTLRYNYEDLDGDGVLLDPKSDDNRVILHRHWVYNDIHITTAAKGIDAGEDRSFLTSKDNGTLFYNMIYRMNEDTLYYLDMKPSGDSEYIVPVNDNRDSTPVEIHKIRFSRDEGWRKEKNYTVTYFHNDPRADYLTSYERKKEWTEGRSTVMYFQRTDGGKNFSAGDSIYIHDYTIADDTDSLFMDSIVYKVKLDQDSPPLSDFLILEWSQFTRKSVGKQREITYTLIPDQPLSPGYENYTGSFEMKIVQSDDLVIVLTGIVASDEIVGAYQDSDGVLRDARWDRDGNFLE
ncbi:hypothetical protein QA601_01790 [Chitinispirillales bacterium ANBcel5]|uniref:hypothetical protein n=1 Tax=Cellulosispirillum alkaliphilum TaxID=3039283 RepID=UPI002A55485C|nr:hypothetical protein [Chitinispirillales bacterium ANBcel5]